MSRLLAPLLSRVMKVRVEGPITQKLTDDITEGFSKAGLITPTAVVVVINSPGGSLAQTKHISDVIRHYGERKNVPIYCFAEDQCLGSANALLTLGVKSYASDCTLLGDFNFSWGSLWFSRLAQRYNVKVDYIHGGENKVKFNPFEEIKPESQKWMQNYLYLLEHELKCTVINQRSKNFTQKNMDKEEIQRNVLVPGLITPENAVKSGFIDEIKSLDEVLREKLSSAKVHEVNKRHKRGLFRHLRSAMGLLK